MGQLRRPQRRRNLRLPALPEILWHIQDADQSDARHWLADLPDRQTFDRLAARDDIPGALGIRALKFLIGGVGTDKPELYFMDTARNPLHYFFVTEVLGVDLSIQNFNRVTYFTDQRQFLAGTILAYDSHTRPDGTPGLYALEFWPTDPVSVGYIAQAYHMVSTGMGFASDMLAYHPSGDIQEQRFTREEDAFAAQNIRTISTSEIFEGVSYSPLNLGEALGVLRLVSGDNPTPPSATDIVIYETLPNDLPLVAGVITSAPQTPLSHVNLRAQQNDTPNAYLRNAGHDPTLQKHIGKPIQLLVQPDGLTVQPVSTTQMLVALAARRPGRAQTPARDLGPRRIVPLDDLAWLDMDAFGAKATNLAELRRIIDPAFVPNGFAVPFSFYHDFMTANALYDVAYDTITAPSFQDDALRPDMLKALRRAIKDAPVPDALRDQLNAMHRAFPVGTTPRCRSSANNEDLVGFTGAGLYDSYTHRLDEGHIEKSIKQVWSSLWTLRAFNERDFYRIDHMTAAMGVLVHPNFDDERVNGVALTRNLYFPDFEGYFINAQVGEIW